MLIPQSMGYALLAGLPPQIGLYSAVLPLIAYAAIGWSRQLGVGPTAISSLLTSAGLAHLSGGDPKLAVELAATLAVMVGLHAHRPRCRAARVHGELPVPARPQRLHIGGGDPHRRQPAQAPARHQAGAHRTGPPDRGRSDRPDRRDAGRHAGHRDRRHRAAGRPAPLAPDLAGGADRCRPGHAGRDRLPPRGPPRERGRRHSRPAAVDQRADNRLRPPGRHAAHRPGHHDARVRGVDRHRQGLRPAPPLHDQAQPGARRPRRLARRPPASRTATR